MNATRYLRDTFLAGTPIMRANAASSPGPEHVPVEAGRVTISANTGSTTLRDQIPQR